MYEAAKVIAVIFGLAVGGWALLIFAAEYAPLVIVIMFVIAMFFAIDGWWSTKGKKL